MWTSKPLSGELRPEPELLIFTSVYVCMSVCAYIFVLPTCVCICVYIHVKL